MNSGNHLADQADKERERRGECSCGGQFKEVEMCEPENDECMGCCSGNELGGWCPDLKVWLVCRRCGARVEPA